MTHRLLRRFADDLADVGGFLQYSDDIDICILLDAFEVAQIHKVVLDLRDVLRVRALVKAISSFINRLALCAWLRLTSVMSEPFSNMISYSLLTFENCFFAIPTFPFERK